MLGRVFFATILFSICVGFVGESAFAGDCSSNLRDLVNSRISYNKESNGLMRIINLVRERFKKGNLESHLLKVIPDRQKHPDLPENYQGLKSSVKAHIWQNKDGRFQSIKDLRIADIIAAPGHSVLRSPEKIQSLADVIRKNVADNLFSHDPLIINIITNAQEQIVHIDGWNGHHRLVAYLEAGKTTIGEMGLNNLTILVNGHAENGQKWAHWLPAQGVDLKSNPNHSRVTGGDDPFTLSFDGGLSNFDLGSRYTVQGIKDRMALPKLKVGVYFGSFDPVHEGHMDIALKAKEKLGLDEVILIPNENPLHKPNITPLNHRLNMLARRAMKEKGINVYIGSSGELVDQFGNKALLLRLMQLYGTDNLRLIQGTDSMEKLISLGQVRNDGFPHVVFPRDSASTNFTVPAGHSDFITFINYVSQKSTSSTEIRNRLKVGKPLDGLLDPALVHYIKENDLYK